MKRLALAAALALVSLEAPPARGACPSRPSWPTQGFPRRTEETARLFPDEVAELERYAFTLTGDDEERRGIRTDGLMIVHQGAVFYERYARGWDRDAQHIAWSVTKTFTNLLTGVAVRSGVVSVDDSVCRHLPSAPPDRCDLTIANLLDFASGVDWAEDYEGAKTRQESSVIALLYGEGRHDMASFFLRQERSDPPGAAYRYSTGDTTMLGAVIDEAMRPTFGDDYPWTLLFDRLGVEALTIEEDGAGRRVGGAYAYARLEDWARVGWFMLNDGCWADERLLPEGWMAENTAPSEAFLRKRNDAAPGDQQGRELWLNRVLPGVVQPWPRLPEDAYSAIGHWGQLIGVIPSKDIVIVRSGDDRDDKALSIDELYRLALRVTGQDGIR